MRLRLRRCKVGSIRAVLNMVVLWSSLVAADLCENRSICPLLLMMVDVHDVLVMMLMR